MRRFSDLSGLVSAGRADKGVPKTRAEVLAALLRKRATAWQNGMDDLEARLRNQISWSLPIEKPAEPGPGTAGEGAPPAAATKRRKRA